MKNKLTIAIIGFGKMGQIRYNNIEKNEFAETKYIYDEHNFDKIPKKLKVDSIDKIMLSEEIDGIIICTPNYLNYKLTIQSLENNKFVFCEKPPAFNSKEVQNIQIKEKESSKHVMYGFNHRQHDSIIFMNDKIESGELGKILWMRGRYGKSVDQEFFNSWRSDKSKSGGGILIDQGIHMIDLLLFFGKEFDTINSLCSQSYWNLEVEDNVFAIFKNSKTNVTASLHSTMTQWRHLFSLEIFLSKGYMVLNGLKTSSNSYGNEELSIAINRSEAPAAKWSNEEKHLFSNNYNFWEREVNEFIETIKNNRMPKFGNSEQAYKVMKVIDNIYEQNKP